MKHNSSNKGGFTLLVILGVVGFLLILLTGIFKVVLFELKDTKDMDYYLKSRTASESGEEIALLKIKENGFGYDGEIAYTPGNPQGQSIMLSENPGDDTQFLATKDVFFSYDIDSMVELDGSNYVYEGTLPANGGFQVIPLFYNDGGVLGKTITPNIVITSGDSANFIWQFVGQSSSISGTEGFSPVTPQVTEKSLGGNDGQADPRGFELTDTYIGEFLGSQTGDNYLTILNRGSVDIEYTMTTTDASFTKPITTITSSAKIGEIKQNTRLRIDNSQYFDVLKYSIYDSQ